jgi:hypothetical protein
MLFRHTCSLSPRLGPNPGSSRYHIHDGLSDLDSVRPERTGAFKKALELSQIIMEINNLRDSRHFKPYGYGLARRLEWSATEPDFAQPISAWNYVRLSWKSTTYAISQGERDRPSRFQLASRRLASASGFCFVPRLGVSAALRLKPITTSFNAKSPRPKDAKKFNHFNSVIRIAPALGLSATEPD